MQKKSKEDVTVSEICILKLLWQENRAMTAAEMIDHLPELNLILTSIYVILQGMIRKGFISFDGMKRYAKRAAKTYRACISPEAFAIKQMDKMLPAARRQDRLPGLVCAFVDTHGIDMETICELEEYVKKKRKELEQ